jgi:hypothetical protein
MKINMAKATVEWLAKWTEEQAKKPNGSMYLRRPQTQAEAQKRYLSERLELYIQTSSVGTSQVTFTVSTLNREDMKKLMGIKLVLEAGEAVMSYVDTETYYEAYCEDPSTRLEITFSVPRG